MLLPSWHTPKDTLKRLPLFVRCMQTDLCSPMCSVFVVCKVRSHLAALKSSNSVASSNSSISAPPVVSRSHSFSEPLVPSFDSLHLHNSHESHHHSPSSSSPSSSSTAARTDPQPIPQSRPSPYEPARSEDVPPRVRIGRRSPRILLAVVKD